MPFVTDIYSFALTACFMMLKEIPDTYEIYSKSLEFPSEYSQDLINFVLVRAPEKRPKISEIKESSYLKNFIEKFIS